MGSSTKLNSILQNPLVETIINLFKKLKSSKSYWLGTYLQKYQESFEFMEKAVKINEAMLPANHPSLIRSKNALETMRAKLN
ncbi:MAG: Unknown protein [uncultured Sulfurovum sp.]|uniref:Uncharacterized protein n=1 Tax=uncultured Sulfurovum sp. TaxID=269237 RepID=A0A6S6U3Y7_9BACT|nr:MAG: Unknown protein [uncultured Sulfurovum sp.]